MGTRDGVIEGVIVLYARTTCDAHVPVWDFSGFPPAILTSGTQDLYLSNTVRVSEASCRGRGGHPAALEGRSIPGTAATHPPRDKGVSRRGGALFDAHLGT
jgi:hypothetical protein